MTIAQKHATFDAVAATLRLLAERRTKGRMLLYLAVRDLKDSFAPMPPYATRKAMRDATLAVGRAS